MENVKLVATDLDGTFLRNDHSVSRRNLNALSRLGKNKITSVAATGRNLRKVREVTRDAHFDFIVFSSGAGILDCHNDTIISYKNISAQTAQQFVKYLCERDFSFHAFHPAPDNHKLWYRRGSESNEEFEQYFQFHNSYNFPLPDPEKFDSPSCQFLVIIPHDEILFRFMK
ncbi:MAG: HAD family hydrolase, partial [Prolixibacteraceae bacterium]|nr:HAD family hydrolase [Prolixibacteraceae bacterium]